MYLHVKEGSLLAPVVEHGQRRAEALRVELAALQVRVEADGVALALGRLGQIERAHAVLIRHPFAAASIGRHLERQQLAKRLLHAGQVGRARLRRILSKLRDVRLRRLRALPHGAVDREDDVVRRHGEPHKLLVGHLDANVGQLRRSVRIASFGALEALRVVLDATRLHPSHPRHLHQ